MFNKNLKKLGLTLSIMATLGSSGVAKASDETEKENNLTNKTKVNSVDYNEAREIVNKREVKLKAKAKEESKKKENMINASYKAAENASNSLGVSQYKINYEELYGKEESNVNETKDIESSQTNTEEVLNNTSNVEQQNTNTNANPNNANTEKAQAEVANEAPKADTTPSTPAAPSTPSTPSTPNSSGADLALTFLGVPYVFGGKSPSGFDCSGLVQYVYGLSAGTTYTQTNLGTHNYDIYNAPRGALVFFGSDDAPYHVGISLGDGSFVHAPEEGDVVKITQMQYFTPSFYINL